MARSCAYSSPALTLAVRSASTGAHRSAASLLVLTLLIIFASVAGARPSCASSPPVLSSAVSSASTAGPRLLVGLILGGQLRRLDGRRSHLCRLLIGFDSVSGLLLRLLDCRRSFLCRHLVCLDSVGGLLLRLDGGRLLLCRLLVGLCFVGLCSALATGALS